MTISFFTNPSPFRLPRSALHSLDDHFLIDQPASLNDCLIVEHHSTVAHRHVIMAAGRALAAALAVWPGREQEIARKHAGCRAGPFWLSAVQAHPVPTSLRIHTPPEMRGSVGIAVFVGRFTVGQPVTHKLSVKTALDFSDVAFA